jgi:hypothetical protein
MLSGVYCLAGGGLVLISGAVILLMQQPDPLAGLQGFIGLVMSVVGFGYACYGIFLMLTARKWMDRRHDV